VTLRSLVLAKDTAWPQDTGYRQRLHAVVRGLGAAGPVDCVTVSVPRTVLPAPPEGLVRRTAGVEAAWLPRAAAGLRFATSWRAPHWVTGRDWSAARRQLPAALAGPYDVVWCSQADVWVGLEAVLPAGPTIVDLDNVMSVVVAREAGGSATARAARREDARRWRVVERRALLSAQAVAVCSELDAERLRSDDPMGGLVVLPNGAAAGPSQRSADPRPVLLFVASLDYPPNSQAALWCAREVLPLVRQQVPEAVLRVVGRSGAASSVLLELQGQGVEVVGRVDDVRAELARAAIAVAPLLQGGGTRIKVLEAFGAALPTVSTTVGAEGIAAQDGEHLLLADTPSDFAAACVRLLRDPEEAVRMGAAARALHADTFDWAHIEPRITELARAVVARGGRAAGDR
jgi:glycosyltransferase involved in cell wall biosynthesis